MEALYSSSSIAIDVETTGLYWQHDDELFSIAIATEAEDFYWDIRDTENPKEVAEIISKLFSIPYMTIYAHNAKFELHMLNKFCKKYGVEFKVNATILDTEVLARMVKNDALSTSLDSVASWYGFSKDSTVDKWIKDNSAYVQKYGEKQKDFTQVPRDIIKKYNISDARLCLTLANLLLSALSKHQEYLNTLNTHRKTWDLCNIEAEFTVALYEMEEHGIETQIEQVKKLAQQKRNVVQMARKNIAELTGRDFVDSGKFLEEAFRLYPDDYVRIQYTEKGNPSFKDEFLSTFTSPLAREVQRFREANKEISSFYEKFGQFVCADKRIRANFRQAGTKTSRLSCSEPNLQNIKKPEESEESKEMRNCFVASGEFDWLSIDYVTQEYRMLLDIAKENDVIDEILAGVDLHQATANVMGVTRQEAKTLNFMLLYGSGAELLAERLNISVEEAKYLKSIYFRKLPNVSALVRSIIRKAEKGRISNWAGRVYVFNKDFAYKAPNYLIQGGCADVVKRALIKCNNFLKPHKSKLILQVHDELDFYLHKDEHNLVYDLQSIMESIYPFYRLKLTTKPSIGKAWGSLDG